MVYVGHRITHFTGYCCWLCCASGNTLYWLLLLAYEGPRTTHFAGYCCGLWEVLGNTHYWASLGLIWCAFINGFKIILFLNNIRNVTFLLSPPKLLKRISLHKQNHMHCFPVSQLTSTNVPQSDKSHIHKFLPFPNRPEDGYNASIQYNRDGKCQLV
jgi:hypothetical protein